MRRATRVSLIGAPPRGLAPSLALGPARALAIGFALVLALLLVLALTAAAASAEPWVVTAEGGAERDSNVQRVETGPELPSRITAWVMRLGARVEGRGKVGGGPLSCSLSDLTRVVGSGEVAVENVTVLASNVRWLHRVGARPVLAGIGLTATDALPLSDDVGARTFRNLGADALLAMRTEDEHELAIAFGMRDFTYKPDHKFDWTGPAVNARLGLMLWQPAAKTRSLELVATLGFEHRAFEDVALVDDCPPDAPPNPNCTSPTDIQRRDRYQRLGVELTWVGRQVAGLGYQITIIDSNDFGQSLARHRIAASATAVLPGEIYGTLLAILQIDQYLDGLVVRRDVQTQEFANIEDENRSSLQLRLAHALAGRWSVEGRAAIWRNLAGNAMELDFRRELVYLGLVYGK